MLRSRLRAFFTGLGFPPSGSGRSRISELRTLVERFAIEAGSNWWRVEASSVPAGAQLLAASPEDQVIAALIAVELFDTDDFKKKFPLERLLSALFRKKPPFTDEQLGWLIDEAVRSHASCPPITALVGAIDHRASRSPLGPELERAVGRLRDVCALSTQTAEVRRLAGRLGRALGAEARASLTEEDAWSRQVLEDLESEDPPMAEAWGQLLALGLTASGSKPSRRTLGVAKEAIGRIGQEAFRSRFTAWAGLAGPRPRPEVEDRRRPFDPRLTEPNASILRGLVWAASLLDGPEIARTVGDLGIACFRKIANVGPVSVQVGNACIWALGAMQGLEAVAQLGRLGRKLKYAQAQRLTQSALSETARRTGMSPEELEEVAVPTLGLEPPGRREESLGNHVAVLSIDGKLVRLEFHDSRGKTLKSVPAEVKRDHREELKELKKAHKELGGLLGAQAARLEQLFLLERTWPLKVWRERYLDHGLLSGLARRLIWRFSHGDTQVLGIWDPDAARIVSVDGAPAPIPVEAVVRLWHPLGASADVVLRWRRFLEDRQLVQPFKQAHREIYVLTDAELRTATYSNRFAAHVIRQHQFAALCRERGWRYRLQGGFDSHNTPTLSLPRWGLTAEFWVDGVPDEAQMSDAGIYLHIATDQVRFSDATGPRPLAEVPALLFSEVMRDVDLFVGVCSIGTDPNWNDHGGGRYLDYWREFAFGELGATAQTRKAVLDRLLPRLTALAGLAEIDGKFLRVKGKRRTYKIHLGSGNILMEPNDHYLCIVPDRSADSARVFLPFEGDVGLSLILSKAFLLSRDDRIKDPTILTQIGRS